MRTIPSQMFAFALSVLLCGVIVSAQQKQQSGGSDARTKTDLARVVQLLEASGHNYTKAGENVWAIPFKGESLANFQVVVVYSQGLVVTFVIPAESKNIKMSPELMKKLLRANDEFDRVKIAIDDDGDLVVRIDSSLRVLDDAEFKVVVEQVANATDGLHSSIKEHLTSN